MLVIAGNAGQSLRAQQMQVYVFYPFAGVSVITYPMIEELFHQIELVPVPGKSFIAVRLVIFKKELPDSAAPNHYY